MFIGICFDSNLITLEYKVNIHAVLLSKTVVIILKE